jgi:hypothetical protein
MDMECKFGLIALAMREIGATTKLMAKVNSSMLMEMFTMVNGAMIKLKAKEPILTLMELTMKVSGSTINSTVKEPKAGLMVQDMKEIMKMERKKETES